MDILVLRSDDWHHDPLGVASHPIAQVPGARRAGEALRFTQGCVAAAKCGVSRG